MKNQFISGRVGKAVIGFGILLTLSGIAQDTKKSISISQFRGPGRDGIFPGQNLLKSWPAEGPGLLWVIDSIGNGFGSASVTPSQIFVQGEKDSTNYVSCLDMNGKLLWKKNIGKDDVSDRWPGSHSTPTVVDDLVYCLSGMGDIVCMKTSTGEKVWGLNMIRDLQGKAVGYGFTQSLLVEGNKLFCSPSGKVNNIAALDRYTGKVIWTSVALGESPRCSPEMIEKGGRKIVVATCSSSVFGIDENTGKLLWSHAVDTSRNVHYDIPLFDGNNLYCFSFYGGSGVLKLSLADDGLSIKEVWSTKKVMNSVGGAVRLDDHLVTANKNTLVSLSCKDGKITDSLPSGGAWGAVTMSSDGMVYVYNDKGGMKLFGFDKGKLREISSFKVSQGKSDHLAHPFIRNGILYIRHGQALIAYRIAQGS